MEIKTTGWIIREEKTISKKWISKESLPDFEAIYRYCWWNWKHTGWHD